MLRRKMDNFPVHTTSKPPPSQKGCTSKDFSSNHPCCSRALAAFVYDYVPQTAATTFAFSSVYFLLLCLSPTVSLSPSVFFLLFLFLHPFFSLFPFFLFLALFTNVSQSISPAFNNFFSLPLLFILLPVLLFFSPLFLHFFSFILSLSCPLVCPSVFPVVLPFSPYSIIYGKGCGGRGFGPGKEEKKVICVSTYQYYFYLRVC